MGVDPSRATHEANTYRIANTIAKEAQTSFQQRDFVDWTQIAPRNSVESLNYFDFNLQVLGRRLYAHLLRHQSELKYSDVEEVNPSRHGSEHAPSRGALSVSRRRSRFA